MQSVVKALLSIAVLSATLAYGAGPEDRFGDGTLPLGGGTTTARANDGTLPLLLPNDGTLPLILAGAATNGGATRLNTEVRITQAQRTALPAAQGAALPCQIAGANVSKHQAAGTVSVGTASYAIRGICFDGDSSTMEIVAAGATGSSSLAAPLPAPQPKELDGRLVLVGAAAGHYTVSVKGP